MGSLKDCLRKAGSAVSKDDATELRRLVREDQYTDEEAVLELIEQSKAELVEIAELAEEAGADVAREAPTSEILSTDVAEPEVTPAEAMTPEQMATYEGFQDEAPIEAEAIEVDIDEMGGMRTKEAFFVSRQQALEDAKNYAPGDAFSVAGSPSHAVEVVVGENNELTLSRFKMTGLETVLLEEGIPFEDYDRVITNFTDISRQFSEANVTPWHLPKAGPPIMPMLTPDGKNALTKENNFPAPANRKVFPKAARNKDFAESDPQGWQLSQRANMEFMTQAEADAEIMRWKDIARQVGEREDNSKKVVISLFDATGTWSQPWADAGYTVVRYDNARGDDINHIDWYREKEELGRKGYKVHAVLAAPPCTSFTSTSARWWAEQHDVRSRDWVLKKYGEAAAQFYDRPIDYATALASDVWFATSLLDPEIYAMENPNGRLRSAVQEINDIDFHDSNVSFDPWAFGDPYTKRTQLWGEFNNEFPTAPVAPVEGSKMHKMGSAQETVGGERSATPEGFSYAFFIANDPMARTMLSEQKGLADTSTAAMGMRPLETPEGIIIDTVDTEKMSPNVRRHTFYGTAEPERIAGVMVPQTTVYRVEYDRDVRGLPTYVIAERMRDDRGEFVGWTNRGQIQMRKPDRNGMQWVVLDQDGKEVKRWHKFNVAVLNHPNVNTNRSKSQLRRDEANRKKYAKNYKQSKYVDNEFKGLQAPRDDVKPPQSDRYRLGSDFAARFADGIAFKNITEARNAAGASTMFFGKTIEPGTPEAKFVDEAIELGVLMRAQSIIGENLGPAETYQKMVDLYGQQPNLGTRTSTSVREQAYSTPVPLSYLAQQLSGMTNNATVYEPSAGNGALLLAANPKNVTANEINDDRARALSELLPDATVTSEDASAWSPDGQFDVVIENPPFGVVKDADGKSMQFRVDDEYTTQEIDHAIAMRSLESMQDEGSAVLIVGSVAKTAKTEEARSDAYNGKSKREFYLKLYDQYNVVDHFTVAGELYSRQGAQWPVDVIVIRGRAKSALPLPAVSPPRIYRSWDDLSEVLNAKFESPQIGARQPDRVSRQEPPGTREGDGRDRDRGREAGVDRQRRPAEAREPDGVRTGPVDGQPTGAGSAQPPVRATPTRPVQGERPRSRPRRIAIASEGENARQVTYTPQSRQNTMDTLVPVNMRDAVEDSLDGLEGRVGDIDAYVANELGFEPDSLGNYIAAEQVDAVALAIDNIGAGAAFIIGDQTGIGKGRVVASVIRKAMREGRTPIFVTEKPNLYMDMYRDMIAVGIDDMLGRDPRILMTNAGERIPLDPLDPDKVLRSSGSQVHTRLLREIANTGYLEDYDVVFTTYSQMQTIKKGERTVRMDFLEALAPNAWVVFDESHNAGGTMGMGGFGGAQEVLNRAVFARSLAAAADGVFFSSATYAKRPEVMDLYARTDMKLAVPEIDKLGEAIKKGGVPMQQVVASMLSRAGQYLRRERSFDGVNYNSPSVKVDRKTYADYSNALAAIQDFSEKYIRGEAGALKALDKELKAQGKMISGDSATGGAGATSTSFSSIMHNLIDQMLLSIKADDGANRAIAAIRKGEKPVLTVSNTMGSFLEDYTDQVGIKAGDAIDLNFNELLERYLERTRWVVERKPFMKKGEKGKRRYLTDEEIGPQGVRDFNKARELIRNSDLSKLPVSPIDHMRKRLMDAGYTVGEITRRPARIDYGLRGATYVVRPQSEYSIRGRIEQITAFNNGDIDAMILNQAGATGLSLHASETFLNQSRRRMILVQPEKNIDTHMQMLGRVHRTGQVITPEYDQLVADVPAEKRPAAVLAKKMASLNANTTASRGGALTAEDVPDFMNEYGDQVAARVMRDMPEVHMQLGSPLKEVTRGYDPDDAMRKVTGRIPLLPIETQELVYEVLEAEYNSFLEQKEAAGESILEAKTLDLGAETLDRRQVIEPGEQDSPFADGVYLETADVKRIGKPYPAERVREMVAQSAGVQTQETMEPLEQAGKRKTQALFDDVNSEFFGYRTATLDSMELEKQRNATATNLDDAMTRLRSAFQTAPIGQSVRVRTEAGNFYGVVVRIKKTGKAKNPAALGSWKWTIAIADAAKQMSIPASQFYTPRTAPSEDLNEFVIVEQADTVEDMSVIEAFDRLQTESREERVIVTGNILSGFDHVNQRGAIINFTDSDGNIRQGIMMPRGYNYDQVQAEMPVPFRNSSQVMAFLRQLEPVYNSGTYSADDADLTITQVGSNVRFDAAKAKARGGRYYLAPNVTSALGKDFVSVGQVMRAEVPLERAEAVLDALKEAGAGFVALTAKEHARALVAGQEVDQPSYSLADDGPWYYSPLLEAARGLKQEKGSVGQMMAMLTKTPGVKQDEIEATGLAEYMATRKSPTKTDIVNYLEQNGVQIEERILVENGPYVEEDREGNIWVYKNEYDQNPVIFRNATDDDRQAAGELLDKYIDEEAAVYTREKYPALSFAGGENYREVLLKLPLPPVEIEYLPEEPFNEDGIGMWEFMKEVRGVTDIPFQVISGNVTEGRITYWPQTFKYRREWLDDGPKWVVNHTMMQNAQYRSLEAAKQAIEKRFAKDDLFTRHRGDVYNSPHFGDTNILAHLRISDVRAPDGKKVMLVEEVQSELHQEGKKRGYRRRIRSYDKLEARDYYVSGAGGGSQWEILYEGQHVMLVGGLSEDGSARINSADEALEEAKRRLVLPDRPTTSGSVPDVPFKGNAWIELAIKRALVMAADGGYDRIAWTIGETQVDRYELRRYVERMQVKIRDDGMRVVNILPVSDSDIESAFSFNVSERGIVDSINNANARGFGGKRLSDIVGGPMAREMMEVTKDAVWEGDGLEVGGAGMRAFYDTLMPRIVQKVIKKLDKEARPVITEIGGPDIRKSVGDGKWFVVDAMGEWGTVPHDSRLEAFEASKRYEVVAGADYATDLPGPYRQDMGYIEQMIEIGRSYEESIGTDLSTLEDTDFLMRGEEVNQKWLNSETTTMYVPRPEELGWWVRNEGSGELSGPFGDELAAQKSAENRVNEDIESAWAVDISDGMRSNARKGLPLFALTPQAAARIDDMQTDLQARLDAQGLGGKMAVRLVDAIRDENGEVIPGARGRHYKRLIEVATFADQRHTLDHEVIHALRELSLITPAEWNILTDAAKADEPLMKMITTRYRGRNLTQAKIYEEAVADMYANWRAGKMRPTTLIGKILEKIRDFLTSVGNVFRGNGFHSPGDIFRRISRGEVGARATPIRLPSFEAAINPGTETPSYSLRGEDFQGAEDVTFDSAESEARWQEARKGVGGSRTIADKTASTWENFKAGFARHYRYLPNEARFSEAREKLRTIEAAPQAAKEDALRIVKDVVGDMSAKELDLFTRKLVLDDLSFEVTQEHELPFGMTATDVARELEKVNAALTPAMVEKVEVRNRLIRNVAHEMVRAGVLTRNQIRNPAYYRHQVLDYARAQIMRAKTPGQKLKSPYWARRLGSSLDINANLLEAEFEWLVKAKVDIKVADTIEWFKRSDYNKRDETVAAARASNERLIQRVLQKDIADNGYMKNGKTTSPLNEEWKGFKQRIAIGMQEIRGVIENGYLEVPPEFEDSAMSLLTQGSNSNVFPFLTYIMDNNLAGARGAAVVFKAMNQRKAWTKAMLGEAYAETTDLESLIKRGFAPENHVTWQPEEGKLLFTAKTIPEHVMDRLLDRVADEAAGPIPQDEMRAALESVRTLMAVGGPKYQMVLPVEIADTLNSIRDEQADDLLNSVLAYPLAQWKRWVLINPRRVIKYNLNNLSGDLDAVIAGNPRALKQMPRAIRELYQVMLKGKTPSARYREAVDRGVFDSGLTIQEIPDINELAEFEKMLNPAKATQPIRLTKQGLLSIWRTLQKYTWFRENWLRYAAYLDYAERIEAGESQQSIGYGAARRDMVDAISDPKDRAALLARELVGDYGAISYYGSHIRRKLIPFYSWMEINTKRYYRLGLNAWDQGAAQGFRTAGILGASLGLRTTAWLAIRMFFLYGMVQLWNRLVMGDEYDELSAQEQARLHVILGRDDNGKIRTLRFQGALSDFLGWAGGEDTIAAISEVEKGRAGYEEVLTTMAKAPVNRIANGLTPMLSAPIEATTGYKMWPDVFRPRKIRDQWRNLAQLVSIEHEYDLIFDRPSRGYLDSLESTITYKRDVGENAYNRIKGMTYDWLRREKGQQGAAGYITPRSQAMYEYRKALRFGDTSAARRADERMRELGVTEKDRVQMINRAAPLGALSLVDRRKFRDTLTSRELELLDQATDWYRETYKDQRP